MAEKDVAQDQQRAARSEPEKMGMSAAVGRSLKDKGYAVAQELTDGDERVDLIGEKAGERMLAEIRFGTGVINEICAREIMKDLKPLHDERSWWDKSRADKTILVLEAGTIPDVFAEDFFPSRGVQVAEIDPVSGRITER